MNLYCSTQLASFLHIQQCVRATYLHIYLTFNFESIAALTTTNIWSHMTTRSCKSNQHDAGLTTRLITIFSSVIDQVRKEKSVLIQLQYVIAIFFFPLVLFTFSFKIQENNYENGIAQMIYDKLSVQRNKGKPLFTFCDKKCLNYGEEWEHGILQGLTTSKVIILLMSDKVFFLPIFFFV